jgi:hypothetical protein
VEKKRLTFADIEAQTQAASANADTEYRLLPLFPFNEETTELSQTDLSIGLPAYATFLEEETFFERLTAGIRKVLDLMVTHKFNQKPPENE